MLEEQLCPPHLVLSSCRGSPELCCSSAQGLGPAGTLSSCKRDLLRGITQTRKLLLHSRAEKKHFGPCQRDSWFHSCKNSFPKTCSLCPPAIALFCFRRMENIQVEFNPIGQCFWGGYNTSSLKDFFFFKTSRNERQEHTIYLYAKCGTLEVRKFLASVIQASLKLKSL